MEAIFNKDKPCQSVKIWSRGNMTDDMMLFGWSVFNKFNRDLQRGSASGRYGCVYSNELYAAYAAKTKGGCGSICVTENKS